MTTIPNKPFKTTDELVTLLCDVRGLSCGHRDELLRFLQNNNYYRFTGYSRQWQIDPRQHNDRFTDDASFETVSSIMALDHSLRQLLFEQSSHVEMAIRTRYAHAMGEAYGEYAFYLNNDLYNPIRYPNGETADIPMEIAKELNRSKSKMIAHYRSSEAHQNLCDDFTNLPIWVAVEVLSFGKVSKIIKNFSDFEPAKSVATELNIQWAPFTDVLHSLCVLRNMCAHHSQLWHRRLDIACAVPKKIKHRLSKSGISFDSKSVFAAIIMLNEYRGKIDGDTGTAKTINKLISSNKTFSEGILHPQPK
ncbi:Abi family protein [Bifidobacterium sp. ESL0763]|uniref:Abi family protein n=1 Tax=Bifidobacterium sp. ESL0763 TaxID=2983227 RepID=UPI0023F8A0A0|nr:Abi family protein [Bifidobacterium sp. ESL0763]MDF7663167.1 Abi family protein [Bifidobacterium sp. ESL0763]